MTFYEGAGLLRQRFSNLESALSWLKRQFDGSRTVIMRSAHCARISGRSFDIRVLTQNTGLDQYIVTGMAARLGHEGAWVSNLAKGGRALTLPELMELLQTSYVRQARQLAEYLTSLSLECARLLHERSGSFVEIGIDFVLDSQTEPVFLEVNSKPARWIFVQLAETHKSSSVQTAEFREMRRSSVRTPLRHALSVLRQHKKAGAG